MLHMIARASGSTTRHSDYELNGMICYAAHGANDPGITIIDPNTDPTFATFQGKLFKPQLDHHYHALEGYRIKNVSAANPAPAKIGVLMRALRVFISSIMNPDTEDLLAEREAARAAAEHFTPITVPWAFEAEPAAPKPLLDFFLDAVKECDVFVIIIGEHATTPVKEEARVALDYQKPALVFCRDVRSRDPDAAALRALDVKYDPFTTPADLQEKMRVALGYYLLGLIRNQARPLQVGDYLARLRALAREGKKVRIAPTVPASDDNLFTIKEVTPTDLRFQRHGLANVEVPAGRITEIIDAGTQQEPVVRLNGRLQWITMRENWYFCPEEPPIPDPLGIGIGRESTREPQLTEATRSRLPARPHTFAWSNPERLAGREVFFDDDGKHITSAGQILTCRKTSPT